MPPARSLLLLLTLALLLAGCATSTHASWRSNDAGELRVVRTKTGLIWGPCLPAPGSVSKTWVIKFEGERSTYSPREFRIFSELPNGARFPLTVEGVIEIDRAKHTLRVDLTVAGKPFELNGQFAFEANPT